MNSDLLTVVASVLLSGVTAGLIAARAQRRAQLRERMLTVASDFAGLTMEVLAALRRFKPPKPGERRHRNTPLFTDYKLRQRRADEVDRYFDELRGLRGRIRLHFPGIANQRSTVTVCADEVIAALRGATDACEKFWKCSDKDTTRGKSSR